MRRFIFVLLIALVVLFFALATGFSLYYRLLYVLAFLVVGSYIWTWLSLRWVEGKVERHTRVVHLGDEIKGRITVHNTAHLPKAWIEVHDLSDMPDYITGMAVSLPGKGFRSWPIKCKTKSRGAYTLGPLRVGSGDPFGLFRIERFFGVTQPILIYPKAIELPHLRLLPAELSGEESLRQRTPNVTPHASTVRDYMYGDAQKRIHWPSTARMRRLMVKDFESGKGNELWLFLDMEKRVQQGSGEESTVEYGVTITASVAQNYLARDVPVGLVSYGEKRYLLPAERGALQSGLVMEHLARVKAEGAIPLQRALMNEGNLFGRFATLLIITPSLTPQWVEALDALVNRGAKVIVVLIDPSSFGDGDGPSSIVKLLASHDIPFFLVHRGEDLARALSLPQVAGLSGREPIEVESLGWKR